MDQSQLLTLGKDLLLLISPLVAQGALAKVGEHTTDRVTQLAQRAWGTLQRRLAGNTEAESALTLYQAKPEKESRRDELAELIADRLANDSAAIAELQELVHELRAATGATNTAPSRSHQVNVSGNARVGQAIAGDVWGGIAIGRMDFGDAPAAPRSTPAASPAPHAAPALAPRVKDATLSADGVHFSYGHALLIGVGTYADSDLSAPATATDAQQLASLLCDESVAAYPKSQVRVLSNWDATRAAIFAALDSFAQQIDDKNATAVIFFAGHGIQHPDDFYLLPYDYDPARLAETAISAAQFHAKIGAVRQRARRLIVLLNCCHAGGVGGAVLGAKKAAGGDAPPPAFYQPLVAGSGQIVISSSKPNQKSGATSGADPALTVFGAQLLAGLKGGVPGHDPGIGVLDLFSYLCTRVPADARTITYEGRPLDQRPLLYASEVDQNFAMALRPSGTLAVLGVEDQGETIRALAAAEIRLAAYASEADAPEELVRRRDALLAQLGA
ncbi:MAG: caspase family protein [Kouleothrix sp.]|nr:caspase family protein [Kouleothrix sp.]